MEETLELAASERLSRVCDVVASKAEFSTSGDVKPTAPDME